MTVRVEEIRDLSGCLHCKPGGQVGPPGSAGGCYRAETPMKFKPVVVIGTKLFRSSAR